MSKLATSPIRLRPASPADAAAISAVHCSNVDSWRAWTEAGPRPARYADLSPYQRWLNGGPWLDPGVCAWHLQRLLSGGGLILVAELRGRVLAAAELHPAEEPPPYSRNLNLSTLYVHRNHQGQGLGSALLRGSVALAGEQGCDTFLVAHAEAGGFYQRHGLKPAGCWIQYQVPTRGHLQAGRYLKRSLADGPYESVAGWALPVGRYQNARHDWERTRPGAAPDFAEWQGLRLERYSLRLGAARAVVIFEELPDSRGTAETFVFAPEAGWGEAVFNCVRRLAARAGFEHLRCFVQAGVRLPGAAKTGYEHRLYRLKLKPRLGR